MTNLTSGNRTIGYCTNVHPGTDLASICRNLDQYAVPARLAVGADDPLGGDSLGVGLWVPAAAATELAGQVSQFRQFLDDRRLRPFTINGFPYDNFHQDVVKHRVYRPSWWQTERLDYTKQLAEILAALLPESAAVGSISTLPIGWSGNVESKTQLDQAGANLRDLAGYLQDLESRTGRRIVVAIEPEPGCVLDTTEDVIAWFERHLPETEHRNSITVCHDVCHSAVMMEPQAEVLQRLAAAGISIGKVQVSSAVVAHWEAMTVERRREAIDQLGQFAEDRYLHQTGRKTKSGQFVLAEDLPQLLGQVPSDGDPVGGDEKWVVHFHVPIFLERFGHLTTSQPEVLEALAVLLSPSSNIDFSGHLEIETYAWTVLPQSMRKHDLSEDIAREVLWLRKAIAQSF